MIKCNGVGEELSPVEGVGSTFQRNSFLVNNDLFSGGDYR